MPPIPIEVVIGHFRQPHTVGPVAVVAGRVVGVVVVVVQWHGSGAGDQGAAFQHSKHAVVSGLQGVLLRDRFAQQCRGAGTTGSVHVQHRVRFQPLLSVFFHGVGFQFEGSVAVGTTFGAGFVGQVARRAHPVRGFAFVSVPFQVCLVLFLQTRRLFIDHVGKRRICGRKQNTTQNSMDRCRLWFKEYKHKCVSMSTPFPIGIRVVTQHSTYTRANGIRTTCWRVGTSIQNEQGRRTKDFVR